MRDRIVRPSQSSICGDVLSSLKANPELLDKAIDFIKSLPNHLGIVEKSSSNPSLPPIEKTLEGRNKLSRVLPSTTKRELAWEHLDRPIVRPSQSDQIPYALNRFLEDEEY